MDKIPDKRWNFDFADVELTGNQLVVNSLINYKDLEKKYKDLIGDLSKENVETLKKTFAKKRIREETISFLNKDELIEFFNRIAVREGIESAAVEPTPAAATTSTTGGAVAPGLAEPTTEEAEPVESKYLVSIIESIDFNAKHNGEIIDSTVNGQIVVKNDGEKDRIWDIDIELTGGDNTDLAEKKFHIADLEPQEDWTKDYKIEITAEDKPPIVLTESIDTFPDTEEESNTFILSEDAEQPVYMKLKIENTSDSSVSSIKVSKVVPEDFKGFDIKGETKGSTSKDSEDGVDIIVWEVEELGPGESAELELSAKVAPTEIKTVSSGELKIKYMLEAGTYSGLKPEFVDGLSEEIYYIDRDERDEEPDVWDCQFIFENRSEFPMELQKFSFVSGDENTEYEVVAQEPNAIVNPQSEWVSMPWDLESEDEPTFSENVLYTVFPKIEERLSMSSTIQALEMPVLAVEGVKDYSKNVLRSYRAETLDATIITTIKGDAPIDVIRFEDTIPIDFKNPEKEQMEVTISVKGKKKVIPIEDFDITFEPDLGPEDISAERKMKIEIRDVLENVGMLDDLSTINVKYPLNAVRPAKDARYDAPVLFQGYTKPEGGVLEALIEPEPITVVHERRRTRIGKSVRPGAERDDYEILLIYKNKGDGVKTNIKIADFVPTNFSIMESSMGYESKSQDDGTLLTWILKEVQPDEEVEITYKIHGEGGDYTLKNIEARAFK
ncbi:MAG: hypothetical protein ACTSRG_15245 [Candidatus Helarchaeota archaeon]